MIKSGCGFILTKTGRAFLFLFFVFVFVFVTSQNEGEGGGGARPVLLTRSGRLLSWTFFYFHFASRRTVEQSFIRERLPARWIKTNGLQFLETET